MKQNSTNEKQEFVIGVGFQKTGTSTLREALKILGYRVKDTSSRALIPILKGDFEKVLKIIEPYDAVEDTPWYIIYKELDLRIPNAKFILTIRDEENWYQSVKRHIGDLRSAQHEWIYGRGKGLPKDDKENTIQTYKKHNTEVINYFSRRPDDLLVIDFNDGDNWKKICSFLHKDIPEQQFPHYNKTTTSSKKTEMNRFKFLRKQMKNSAKIKYIDFLGLWDRNKA